MTSSPGVANYDQVRLEYAQTMTFTAIVVSAFVRVGVIRTFDSLSIWSNPWLCIGLAISAFTQLFIIYCPPVQEFFQLQPLALAGLGCSAYPRRLGYHNQYLGCKDYWEVGWFSYQHRSRNHKLIPQYQGLPL